jgi:hypothetical protein
MQVQKRDVLGALLIFWPLGNIAEPSNPRIPQIVTRI